MTDYELDKLARRVMLDAARLEYGGLPEEPHPFSPGFERKMKKFLRRGRHPVWYKALHAAACLLLALLLSGCAVLAVSAEAREAFTGWMREVYENAFVYRFYGEEQEDRELLRETETFYRPAWVPEGYFQVSVEDLDGCSVLTYRNQEAECLTVSYGYVDLSEEEGTEASSVFVGENPASLYQGRAEDGVRHLVWVDGGSGISFRVSGPLEGQELIRIGESLAAFPEPPLEDRQLTWVPAGYWEGDRVRLGEQNHVLYQNDEGYLISFGYRRGLESSGLYVSPSGEEGLVPQTVLVNGKEADLYLDKGSTNALVWTEDGLLLSLLGYCSAEELVAMAESQEVILPDRRPSWVPEGYVLYERSFHHSKESATTIYENPKGVYRKGTGTPRKQQAVRPQAAQGRGKGRAEVILTVVYHRQPNMERGLIPCRQ